LGGGTRFTTASRISGCRCPVFALAGWPRAVEPDDVFDLALHVRSTSALGRSILLRTGMISRLFSIGEVDVGERLRLDALRRVDHEQRALAGLQAASETS
jgi:hypothetical protein